jgi:hypothetical protein
VGEVAIIVFKVGLGLSNIWLPTKGLRKDPVSIKKIHANPTCWRRSVHGGTNKRRVQHCQEQQTTSDGEE